jgi:hypothetical protein
MVRLHSRHAAATDYHRLHPVLLCEYELDYISSIVYKKLIGFRYVF